MLKIVLIVMGIMVLAGAIMAFALTRDGKLVTPEGTGTVTTASGTFEAFPLPDYAAEFITDDYLSYLIEVEPGIKIHVLEVGTGRPVYLQHGNPTSGFLWRRVVEHLPTDRYRVIMPTMVGLGFSSKVPASQHTAENQINWMHAALEQLDLEDVVYVGQDWGGIVGMGIFTRSPDLLSGAVMLNTGIHAPTQSGSLSAAHDLARTPIVGELMLEVIVSIFDRLSEAQGDPASMPQEVADLYGRPLRESGNRKAPLALMRAVPTGPEHPTAAQLRMIEDYIETIDIPVEIVWGMNDPILTRLLPNMEAIFPNAPVTRTQGGHFLQEEVPEEIAAAIIRVVEQVDGDDSASAAATGE
ncbi:MULTISPECIES: alpha/beta fold hydrolase [Hyphobacterium]|uniref:Alpha/beta fold hydrolase n=1 Tax=Hyphobacterium vulgare TaxID=1736751 RepID=A0ABV7A0T8_9PROT